MKESYIIKYKLFFKDGSFKEHTTKVKNSMSEIHAKIKLNTWLEKKTVNFDKIVILECKKSLFNDSSIFDNMGSFGDLFKGFQK